MVNKSRKRINQGIQKAQHKCASVPEEIQLKHSYENSVVICSLENGVHLLCVVTNYVLEEDFIQNIRPMYLLNMITFT